MSVTSRRRARLGLVALWAVFVANANVVRADGPMTAEATNATVGLTWSTDDDATCPSADALRAAVERLLGRAVFQADDADIQLDVAVVRGENGRGARLTLARRDGTLVGTRELSSESASCAALLEPLALVVALLIDLPRDHVSLTLPTPRPSPTDVTRVAPPPTAPPSPSAHPSAPTLDVAIGVEGALGWLPGTPLGPTAELGVRILDDVRLVARTAAYVPWNSTAAIGGLRLSAVSLALGGAWRALDDDDAVLELGLAVGAGWFHAESTGVDDAERPLGTLYDARASATFGVEWLEDVVVLVESSLGVPLVRPEFVVERGTERVVVGETGAIFGTLGVSVRVEAE